MRRIIPSLVFSAALSVGWQYTAWADDIHATTAVSAATVFADRALVSRSGTVKLPAGAHTIIVENMPADFDETSLRVEGEGRADVKIGAVEVNHIFLAELAEQKEREHNKALQAKKDEKALVAAEITALAIKADFIKRVAENGANNQLQNTGGAKLDFTPEKWQQAWNLLHNGMDETAKAQVAKQVALRKIDEEISKLEREHDGIATEQRERREVVVRVEAKDATDFNLVIKYQTPNVTWASLYDARLDTDKGDLLLEQYGQVAQTTGEDWQNVAITLSTARPELGTEMPRLNPWQVTLLRPQMERSRIAFSPGMNEAPGGKASPAFIEAQAEANRHRIQEAAAVGGTALPTPLPSGMSTDVHKESDPLVEFRAEMQKQKDELARQVELLTRRKLGQLTTAQAVTTDYSAEFKVPGKVELKSIATPAKFFVGKVPLKAALHVEVTPRLGTQAYLFAKVQNTEKFPIIPGGVAKYRDGAFMGNAGMSLLRPGETLALSFGIDDRVKVDYQKTSQTQDNPTLYFVGDITVERAYETKIRNLHDKPMRITVFDQHPITADADIKTSLLEDKTTPGFTPDPEKRQGVIQWQTEYKPQEEKVFALAFRVKHPKDTRLGNFKSE